VPFNPTPSAADAEVAEALDVLAPPDTGGAEDGGAPMAAAGGFAMLLFAGALMVRRRRRGPSVALGEVLASVVGPVGPSVTLQALRPRLAALGPSVAALADDAERARFAADGSAEPAYPRLRVWRALARDVGRRRAARLLLRERFQHRAPDVLVDH
jgi:LPXTG-motif cell wall-anchored protein